LQIEKILKISFVATKQDMWNISSCPCIFAVAVIVADSQLIVIWVL